VIVIRLVLILSLITVGMSLVMFLMTRDRRYLRFAWQVFRFVLTLVLVFAGVLMMGRIILYGG